jgi:hypothetical protein
MMADGRVGPWGASMEALQGILFSILLSAGGVAVWSQQP